MITATVMKWVPAALLVLVVLFFLGCAIYSIKSAAHDKGFAAGNTIGIVEGRMEMRGEFQERVDQAVQAAEGRAELERVKSKAYAEQAERELTALGLEQKKARAELAKYRQEKLANEVNRTSSDAGLDGCGLVHIDPAVVGLLDEARAARSASHFDSGPSDSGSSSSSSDSGSSSAGASE